MQRLFKCKFNQFNQLSGQVKSFSSHSEELLRSKKQRKQFFSSNKRCLNNFVYWVGIVLICDRSTPPCGYRHGLLGFLYETSWIIELIMIRTRKQGHNILVFIEGSCEFLFVEIEKCYLTIKKVCREFGGSAEYQ